MTSKAANVLDITPVYHIYFHIYLTYIAHVSNFPFVFSQGMLFSTPDCVKSQIDLVRLWMHESSRVYRDKMLDDTDFQIFDKTVKDITKKTFEVCTWSNL